MNEVCRLEFQVVEAGNTEDAPEGEDSVFGISDACREQLLSMECKEIGYDWLTAVIASKSTQTDLEFAKNLVKILELDLCKKLFPSDFSLKMSERVLQNMENVLGEEMKEVRQILSKLHDESQYWCRKYTLEKDLSRKKELLLDIQRRCKCCENMRMRNKSVLSSSRHGNR